jgi:hypothetical protein
MRYNPPGALSSRGWKLFDDEFKSVAPIRHWIDHDFKRLFVYPIKWAYEEISAWLLYRTFDRYHIVNTGLAPGYHELDFRMLHANFNMLKDFVEVQQAKREYWGGDSKKTWCELHMPFYEIVYPFRRPDLGIKHLEWGATLDDPTLPIYEQSPAQAKYAREMLALYKWWTETRPNRVEVVVRYPSGNLFDIFDPAFQLTKTYKTYRADLNKSSKQEEKWHKEDDAMLVRLIKIRRGLWT